MTLQPAVNPPHSFEHIGDDVYLVDDTLVLFQYEDGEEGMVNLTFPKPDYEDDPDRDRRGLHLLPMEKAEADIVNGLLDSFTEDAKFVGFPLLNAWAKNHNADLPYVMPDPDARIEYMKGFRKEDDYLFIYEGCLSPNHPKWEGAFNVCVCYVLVPKKRDYTSVVYAFERAARLYEYYGFSADGLTPAKLRKAAAEMERRSP